MNHKLKLVCITEIGAHVRGNLCNLICLKHLIRSRAVINSYGNLYAFIRAQRMKPRNHIMINLFGLRL